MIYYVIKTNKGYLATQGDFYWFEPDPTSLAIHPTEESARDIAECHHSTIGTKTDEGYTIKSVKIASFI